MSKGYDRHQKRLRSLSVFGKDLTRRSGGHCELCAASHIKLQVFEVPPVPVEPDIDHCIFICEVCQSQADSPKKMDINHWRCLNTSTWSTVPAVQVMAVILLNRLAEESWAQDLLDQLYLATEIEQWVESVAD